MPPEGRSCQHSTLNTSLPLENRNSLHTYLKAFENTKHQFRNFRLTTYWWKGRSTQRLWTITFHTISIHSRYNFKYAYFDSETSPEGLQALRTEARAEGHGPGHNQLRAQRGSQPGAHLGSSLRSGDDRSVKIKSLEAAKIMKIDQ